MRDNGKMTSVEDQSKSRKGDSDVYNSNGEHPLEEVSLDSNLQQDAEELECDEETAVYMTNNMNPEKNIKMTAEDTWDGNEKMSDEGGSKIEWTGNSNQDSVNTPLVTTSHPLIPASETAATENLYDEGSLNEQKKDSSDGENNFVEKKDFQAKHSGFKQDMKPVKYASSSSGVLESGLENVDLGPSESKIIKSNEFLGGSLSEVRNREIVSNGEDNAMQGDIRNLTEHLHITVTDPVKRVSDHSFIPGLTSSHYEYLVTSTPLPRAAASIGIEPWPRAEVRRRFSDFVSLSDLLAEKYRGYFLFSRPDKGALEGIAAGRSEVEFIEMRRAELEKYLRKLLCHPEIGKSDELRIFLSTDGALATSFEWRQLQPLRGSLAEGIARLPSQLIGSSSSIPTTSDVTKNARYTNDILRRFKELGEKMRQEYQPPSDLEPGEISLRESKAGIDSYAEVLAMASRKSEKLIREMERFGAAYGDLGLSLLRLSNYEEKESENIGVYSPLGSQAKLLSEATRKIGLATVRISRLSRAATSEAVTSLEVVHDELSLGPVAIDALNERESALLTMNSLKEGIEKRRLNIEVLEHGRGAPGDPNKARKVQDLHNEIASLEAALETADLEYQKIKDRNELELRRWRGKRHDKFSGMTNSIGNIESTLYERISEPFQAFADEIVEH